MAKKIYHIGNELNIHENPLSGMRMQSREQAGIKKLASEIQILISKIPSESMEFRKSRVLAGRLHSKLVCPFIERTEKLVTWTTTGFAATIALAIGNYDKLQKVFPNSDIKQSCIVLAATLTLYWLNRMTNVGVLSSGESLEAIDALFSQRDGASLTNREISDLAARLVYANPPPWRHRARKSLIQAIHGDWDAAQRNSMKIAMLSSFIFLVGNFIGCGYGLATLIGY